MKKTISVVLAVIMMLAVCPVVSFAASTWATGSTIGTGEYTEAVNTTGTGTVTIGGTVTMRNSLTVTEGVTLRIATGATLVMSGANAKLIVSKNATVLVESSGTVLMQSASIFENNGTIELKSGSNFNINDGARGNNNSVIENISRINVSENGYLYHKVSIPNSFSTSYKASETWNRKAMTIQFSPSYFLDAGAQSDTEYLTAKYTPVQTVTGGYTDVYVEHNTKIYVKITVPDGDGDFIDVCRMLLTAGGQTVTCDRGVFMITPMNAMTLNVVSTKYADVVKLFKIELPKTDGYYVALMDGTVGETIVEFGKTLQFHVVVGPDYDKSTYSVYVNTAELQPDEYGYYDVTGPIDNDGNMATAGGVQQALTIKVMGVTSNKLIGTMTDVVGFIQQIFSVIKSIIAFFADLFKGGTGDFDKIFGT